MLGQPASRIKAIIQSGVLALVVLSMVGPSDRLNVRRAAAQAGDALTWDFESGGLGDWIAGGQVQVVTDFIDPLTDNSMHAVAQGQYAVMVGDPIPLSKAGDQFSSLERTIQIPQDDSSVLLFSYAVVANDPPAHPEEQKPYFELQVRDLTTGKLLPVSDLKYTSQTNQEWFLGRPPTDQSFSQSGFSQFGGDRWVFIPWRNEKIDLAGRAGHQILVRFTVRDCLPRFHAAYGYLDNIYVGPDRSPAVLPSLIKQPLPAGVPPAPGLLSRVANFVEQFALWPWCLLPLVLLPLGLLLYFASRRRVTPPPLDEVSVSPRPRPADPLAPKHPTNQGRPTSWRNSGSASDQSKGGSSRRD